jgi:hypothetical protein
MNFGEVPGWPSIPRARLRVHAIQQRHRPLYAPTAAQLLEFGPKGEFLREVGRASTWSFAHSVRIDKADNIRPSTRARHDCQIHQAGQVVWVFGRRKSCRRRNKGVGKRHPPLPPVDGLFRQPDVAWDSEGNIYISDGYVNSRVAR